MRLLELELFGFAPERCPVFDYAVSLHQRGDTFVGAIENLTEGRVRSDWRPEDVHDGLVGRGDALVPRRYEGASMRTAKEVATVNKSRNQKKSRSLKGDPKLAERLSSLRASHNLSIREVAAETGVSNPYISQLEAGYAMPSVGVLARLAAFYEVTLNDLAGHVVVAAKNGDS